MLLDLSEFAGKMKWEGDPLAYQKINRNKW